MLQICVIGGGVGGTSGYTSMVFSVDGIYQIVVTSFGILLFLFDVLNPECIFVCLFVSVLVCGVRTAQHSLFRL